MIQGTSCGFATAKLGDGQVGFSGHSSVRPYMLRHSLHSCVFEIFRKNFFFFFLKTDLENSTLTRTGKRAGLRKTIKNPTGD